MFRKSQPRSLSWPRQSNDYPSKSTGLLTGDVALAPDRRGARGGPGVCAPGMGPWTLLVAPMARSHELWPTRWKRQPEGAERPRAHVEGGVPQRVPLWDLQRDVLLPEGATGDDVSASYTDGVLEVRVPMPKAIKPEATKVAIRHG